MPIDDTSVALPADLAELRRGQIKSHGVMVLDVVIGQGTCVKCGAPSGLTLGANTACGFRSVEELVETGAKLAARMSRQGKVAPCSACGGSMNVASAQYHAFHSGLGKDLVVHWTPGEGWLAKGSSALLAWDSADGMSPVAALSADEEARFVHDAAYREARACFEMEDAARGAELVDRLYHADPNDPLLMSS
ncbi:MAG TPA: hypothetical protein VFA20_07640 [Myxococcaceae bacterium]|nr:hypothetical protein [Myxococcaceae bacterium]